MQKNETILYLREILLENEAIGLDDITIEQPKGSNGIQLHIRSKECKQTVKTVAKKRDLAVKEENGEMIVFKSSVTSR
jgi:hypothetical protein